MKKPLMLIPPAQAEALFDAAQEEAPRSHLPASVVRDGRSDAWHTDDWAEDDFLPAQIGQAVSRAHDRHNSSKSSR